MQVRYVIFFLLLSILSILTFILAIPYVSLIFAILAVLYFLEVLLRLKGYSLSDISKTTPDHCPACGVKLTQEERSMYKLYGANIVSPSISFIYRKCPKCGFNLYSRNLNGV